MLELVFVGLIGFAGAIAFPIVFPLFLSWLATRDVWWSPIRKKPNDGRFNLYTRGKDLGGPYARTVESVNDWVFKGEQFTYEKGSGSGDETYLSRLGLAHVGFFVREYSREREYYTYDSAQDKIVLKEIKNEEKKNKARDFYFQTLLVVKVSKAETSDKIEVDVIVPFSMRIINPNRAEFLTGKPEKVIADIVLARARAYIAGKTYHDLLNGGDAEKEEFVKFITAANRVTTKPATEEDSSRFAPGATITPASDSDSVGIIQKHGVEIFAPYIVEINLSDRDNDFAKATRLKATRLEEKEAARVQAETIGILADAEVDRAQRVFAAKAKEPQGGIIALAEAIEKNTKATTLVIGSMPVAINPDKDKET